MLPHSPFACQPLVGSSGVLGRLAAEPMDVGPNSGMQVREGPYRVAPAFAGRRELPADWTGLDPECTEKFGIGGPEDERPAVRVFIDDGEPRSQLRCEFTERVTVHLKEGVDAFVDTDRA